MDFLSLKDMLEGIEKSSFIMNGGYKKALEASLSIVLLVHIKWEILKTYQPMMKLMKWNKIYKISFYPY